MPLLLLLIALFGFRAPGPTAEPAPLVDHHQHLFDADTIALARAPGYTPIDAAALVRLLDEAGIRRAVVLSLAYQYGNPNRPIVADEYARVKAENDWTSAEVARVPDRLVGFCGVDPLKEYAIEEIRRCAADPHLSTGLKLHFGNSDVDLDNPEHVARLRRVFQAASDRGMAIVVHLRPSVTRQRPYGATEARVFLNEVLPSASSSIVQIAHLAGAGGYDDPAVDAALSVFVEAIARRDPRMDNVFFDVSGIAGAGNWKERAALIARRIRQVGIPRVLYGSDGAAGGGLEPRAAWAAFRELPLSSREIEAIARNVAPYLR